jgi:hypothetical protein
VDSSKRHSVSQKRALLDELSASGESLMGFCARRHVSTASVCKWKRDER